MRKKLKDVCMFYSGTGFPIQYQGQTKGEYPFYKVGDIANNAIAGKIYLELCNNYISSDVAKMIKGCILPKDTVVFAKIGEALKLNRRAITSCDCLIDNNAMGIAPKLDFLRIQYFYFCMKNLKMQTLAESTTVPSVRKTVLEKYEIEVPSLVEQEEIEKKLTLTQKIIEKRRQELSYLDEIIKARFVEMFGNPVTNEKGWKQRQLGEITTKIGSGATPKGGKEAYQEEGITLIRSMNVHNGLFEYKELAHISEEQAEKLDNVTIEENDVLLNITGASVARSCVVPSKILPARVNQHVCIIRCNQCIVPEFLNKLLIDDNYQRLLWSIAEAGATREAITKQQVESLQIIMPPIELQEQFADFVHQVDKSKFDTMTFAPIYAIINLYLHTYFYQGRR